MSDLLTSKEFDKSNKVLFYLGSALSLLLLIFVFVLFFFFIKQSPTPVKNLEIESTTSLKGNFDKKDWLFEVLYPENSASKAAGIVDKLASEGYKINATGAASPNQKTITLRVNPEMREKAPLLLKNLSQFFTITSFSADFFSENANVQLILNQ